MRKDEVRQFYLDNIQFDEVSQDRVIARVKSFSNPGRHHKVIVTRDGAVCDCLGVLNLKVKDFCVHVETVLEKLESDYNINFVVESMSLDSYYLKTNTFLDRFGGLTRGDVTLLYGPDGSGKTQALLTLASSLSKNMNEKILYIITEGTLLYAKRRIQQMGGDLNKIIFMQFSSEPELHVFLGGDIHSSLDYYFLEDKIGGKELGERRRRMTETSRTWRKLEDVNEDICAIIVDSITTFYSSHINTAKPQDRPHVASVFAGNVNIYHNYVARLFSDNPVAMVWSAWLRSGVGDLLKKGGKEKAEKDIQMMQNIQDRKEWVGPEAVGHICKVIYKILPEGIIDNSTPIFSLTQVRGEHMGKKILCKITSRGVELVE